MSFLDLNLKANLKLAIHAAARRTSLVAGNGWVPTFDHQWFKLPSDIYREAYLTVARNRYEQDERDLVVNRFEPADTIVEIGSNIGYLARYAFLQKLNPNGKYIGVEPNPTVHDALVANMEFAKDISLKSGISRTFEIIQAAICNNHDGMVAFSRTNDLGSHVCLDESQGEANMRVPAMTFAALLNKYAPGQILLICDAEGAEFDMLQEPQTFTNVKQIVMELHEKEKTGRPETIEDGISQLRELGFIVHERRGNSFYLSRDPA